MARTRTPFRNLIFFLRIAAGIFAAAGLALYCVILVHVVGDYAAEEIGLTTLPVAAGAISIFWNIASIIFMRHTRTSHLFLAIGDFLIFVAVAVLGSIGFAHDNVTYLNNGEHWEYDNWLQEEEIGATMLLVSVLIQLLLVLFNFFEHRHLKKTGRRASLPPYPGAYPGVLPLYMTTTEKKGDWEVDWKSVVSEESHPSSIKKPVAAVV
ncbi:uncharacterized protein PAC_11375 [Phialocephala subalpina]|uniref:Uncharacterized protein n=1 Tax=Phialocephala subalpina TaxID=576137 RepID=A0A1L7X8X7_9HELO|nr:uncharacterized protein PAC_11375 [Phialocephala subalpina]